MSDASKNARRENRKNTRIQLADPLRVVLGSIGATIRYEMVTRNISVNGFFLDFDKPGRFPFNPSSIMEVWLELEPGKTIFFNGKMARVVKKAEQQPDVGVGIAIKIVQIDRDNDNVLRDFVMSKHAELHNNSQIVA